MKLLMLSKSKYIYYRYYADKEDAYNMRKYFDMEFREINLKEIKKSLKKH